MAGELTRQLRARGVLGGGQGIGSNSLPASAAEAGYTGGIAIEETHVLLPPALGGLADVQSEFLRKFYSLLEPRTTKAVRLAFTGSSTTEGVRATAPEFRYVNLLMAALQNAFPSGRNAEVPTVANVDATWPTVSTATGLAGYNSGHGGKTAADYMPDTEVTKIAALNPVAIFHMVGSNDYASGITPAAYKANVRSRIAALDAAITADHVHLLIQPYARQDAAAAAAKVANWSEYGDALKELTSINPAKIGYFDISFPYDALFALGLPGDYMDPDLIHQNNNGHSFMTRLLMTALQVPRGKGSSASTVAPPSAAVAPVIAVSPGDGQYTVSIASPGSGYTTLELFVGTTSTNLTSGTSVASTLPSTRTGATNGTTYYAQVRVTGPGGTVVSNVASGVPASVAAAPTSAPVLSSGATTASSQAVNWTASAGSQSYRLEYKRSVDSAWTAVSGIGGLSTVVNALSAETSYDFRVYGYNTIGDSPVSNTVTVVTSAVVTSAYAMRDSFTDAAGTSLYAHTGESGHTWARHASLASSTADAPVIDDANRARFGAVSGSHRIISNWVPASPNYRVEFDLTFLGKVPTAAADAGQGTGMGFRYGTTVPRNGYYFRYTIDAGATSTTEGWVLSKVVSDTATAVVAMSATPTPVVGIANHVSVDVNGSTITCKVDGTTVVSVTDTSITAAGTIAILGGVLDSLTTGARVDNVAVTAL